MQYLYGSGEGAAASIQAYAALTNYLKDRVAAARKGDVRQAVLSDGASLNQPHFENCGKKPLAAVFDVDETALLNLGYEGDEARRGLSYDEARWLRWEQTGADKVVAVPGAHVAIKAARAMGVVVIFNSNRSREKRRADRRRARRRRSGAGKARHDAVAEGRRRRRIEQGRPALGDRQRLLRGGAGRGPARRLQRPVQRSHANPLDSPRASRIAATGVNVGGRVVRAAKPGVRHGAEGRGGRHLPLRHALDRSRRDQAALALAK
jgi:hypothetical protein